MTRISIPGVLTISGGSAAVIILFVLWVASQANTGGGQAQPSPATPTPTPTPTPVVVQQESSSSGLWFTIGLLLGIILGLIGGLTGAYVFWRVHGDPESRP
jgi:hypothetical protein